MAAGTELIRVSKPTKVLLNNLKIIEAESFDAVISRIIQTKLEDHLQLSKETTQMLNKRFNKMQQGKAYSGNELMEKIAKRRAGQ